MYEAGGMIYLHILVEPAMQKGVLNNDLSNGPYIGDVKRKNKTNGGGLNHWAICVAKVAARLLVEALATRRRMMEPSTLCLRRKTHLQPTMFMLEVGEQMSKSSCGVGHQIQCS